MSQWRSGEISCLMSRWQMRAGGKHDFHCLLELPASGSSKTWQRTLLWKPKVLAMVNLVAAADGGTLSAPLVQRVTYKWNSGTRNNQNAWWERNPTNNRSKSGKLWVIPFFFVFFSDFMVLSRNDLALGSVFIVRFSLVTQSCPTLWDPMNHSTPGLPVHRQLPESAQSHVHWVGDAIQPSHPLSPPFPPALSLSQHQGLFQWVSSSHQVAKAYTYKKKKKSKMN